MLDPGDFDGAIKFRDGQPLPSGTPVPPRVYTAFTPLQPGVLEVPEGA